MARQGLDANIVRDAALRAAEILTGMGYHGKYGSVHLLRLNIQTNTLTAILHNMIAWQISELDNRWKFYPKGGSTPDLLNDYGQGIQIKATSNKFIKGNKVSANEGYYIVVKYSRAGFAVEISEILMGELHRDDWERPARTQWAILKPEAESRLRRIYP
ncbi:MAG TPA: hypothetical protein G4O03_01435 [Dehalococcoidia bacterium]|nr:hypothetical protein [Dehalococcoidia bacterium]